MDKKARRSLPPIGPHIWTEVDCDGTGKVVKVVRRVLAKGTPARPSRKKKKK